MNQQEIINKFKNLKYGEDNIDAIYQNNFLLYKYHLSDIKNLSSAELEYNDGIVINKKPLASNLSEGFHIEENDFKVNELKLLDLINLDSLTYGEIKKHQAYREFIEFKIKYPDWYKIKNRNGFYSLERSKIVKYKNAIYSGYFENMFIRLNKDGSQNQFYFYNQIKDWKNQRDELLRENENLKPRIQLLLTYNATIRNLFEDLLKFFEVVEKYDGSEIAYMNSFNMKHFDVIQGLESVGRFSQNINHNINTGHYKIALEIQHYCWLMFDDIIGILYNSFYVDIWKSPLSKDFRKIENKLKNAIDIEKLNLLLKVGGTSRKPTEKDIPFEFNFSDKLFKSIEGEKIFEKFHSHYFNQNKVSKHYSFLYYALEYNNYIFNSKSKYLEVCGKLGLEKFSFATRNTWDNVSEKESMKMDFSKFEIEVKNMGNTNQNKSETK